MSKWTVIFDDGQIGKDGLFHHNLDLSWLPTSIRAVQSLDGVTCTIEHGDRATETNTHNDDGVATSSLAWWPNVETTWQAAQDAWQAAYDAKQAALAEALAAAEAEAQAEATPE